MLDLKDFVVKTSEEAIVPCPQMSSNDNLSSILKQVHPEWRLDFLKSIQGRKTSKDFIRYFNKSKHIRYLWEKTIRFIDSNVFRLESI